MFDLRRIRAGALAVALSLAAAPLALQAQTESQEDRSTVSLNDVKARLKENERFLKEAQKKGKAGDARGTQTALENFSRRSEALDRAMARGRFEGSESQREEAFERVEKATRKHTEVLTGLLDKVPEQARPHIEHAIEVSQRGHDHAAANLQQARTRREAAEQKAAAKRQDGARRPDSTGGRPDGVGMGATGSGRPGGTPPAPPARPGKRP